MLFPSLDLWVNVLLYVALGLLCLFVLTLLLTLIFLLIFSRKIKNTSIVINLLLSQRYELMLDFLKFASNAKIKIPQEEIDSIANLERIIDFQSLSKQDRDQRVLSFVHAAHNIISLCDRSPKLLKDEHYNEKLVEFNDIEETYRQKSALYNADVIGYNYWINIPFVKILFRIFGKRNKDLIV